MCNVCGRLAIGNACMRAARGCRQRSQLSSTHGKTHTQSELIVRELVRCIPPI